MQASKYRPTALVAPISKALENINNFEFLKYLEFHNIIQYSKFDNTITAGNVQLQIYWHTALNVATGLPISFLRWCTLV